MKSASTAFAFGIVRLLTFEMFCWCSVLVRSDDDHKITSYEELAQYRNKQLTVRHVPASVPCLSVPHPQPSAACALCAVVVHQSSTAGLLPSIACLRTVRFFDCACIPSMACCCCSCVRLASLYAPRLECCSGLLLVQFCSEAEWLAS